MKKSLRVLVTLAFTIALLAALAITASAQNWYATEYDTGVSRLYITAADSKPVDGKTWYNAVPAPFNTSGNAWISIPSTSNLVEIVISGDVVCPADASFDYGIYQSSGPVNAIKINGNSTGTLTINLTGRTHNASAAIYNGSSGMLTISNMAGMALTASKSDGLNYGIFSPFLTITDSTLGNITAGDAITNYGICANGSFTITNSTLGDITAGDASNSYGIFAPSSFMIIDSTLGDITAGNAGDESCGIFAPNSFMVAYSTLGDITAGNAGDESCGIFAPSIFMVISSTLGDITAGNAGNASYGINAPGSFTVTESTLGDIMAGNARNASCGINAPGSFTVTKSSLGDITSGTASISHGIFAPNSFTVTKSTLGDIMAGNAGDDSCGIFASGSFTVTESSLGDIMAGNAGNASYGIFAPGSFTITNSTLGNITAGNTDYYSSGINTVYLTISGSSLGNIEAGNAGNESYGIYAPGSFTVTDSTLGDIIAGNVEQLRSCGIYAPSSFTITDSKLGNITAGNAGSESYGIYASSYFTNTITDSSLGIIAAGDAEESYGIRLNNLTIGAADLEAKYPLDITATGYSLAIYLEEGGSISFIDDQRITKLAGADKDTAAIYSDNDEFDNALRTAKYASIYLQRVETPVITESTLNQQGKKLITITCATPGAKIYYRLDGGAIGSPEDGTLYTGPFEVGEDVTVTARGFKEEYVNSRTATLTVEFEHGNGADLIQYIFLIANQPTYGVSAASGVKVAVKAGLNPNALRAGELVTLAVEAGEDGEYTAPTVTTVGGGKVYLTDLGGGVYTFKMPSRSVIVKP